jgi:isopenicillin-N epimerase
METTRRNFLRTAGAAALATAGVTAAPHVAAARTTPMRSQGGGDAAFWRRVKSSFTLDKRAIYMNIGTTGSTPRHVLRAYDEYNQFIARYPREGFDRNAQRARVATGLGANRDEILITDNTTDGMTTTLLGVELEAGDEVLTTNHEHPAGTGPMSHLAERHGVIIKEVDLPVGPDQSVEEYVELFGNAITDNTKVICFSHITFLSGTLLPAKEICQLAIERGITTIVDGAHTTGMMDLDLHDMGVDFYPASGHKWQCGPGGTGILYARNAPNDTNPNELPMIWSSRGTTSGVTSRYGSNGAPIDIGGYLQSGGNRDHPATEALADVCDYWQELGRARIEEYILGLSATLKAELASLFGRDALLAPDNPDLLCALTAFNPFDDKTDANKVDEFVNRLREDYGVIIRSTNLPAPDGTVYRALRVSTHLFHDQQDVDTAVKAIADLTNDMGID